MSVFTEKKGGWRDDAEEELWGREEERRGVGAERGETCSATQSELFIDV